MAKNPIVGGIGFEITAEDDKFIQQLRKAGERGKRELQGVTTEADRLADELKQAGNAGERAMKGLAREADRAGDQMKRTRDNANALRNTVSGLALGAVFAAGTKVVAEFGQAMSTVEAVTGATGASLSALEAKAKALGATTRFSATEAAEGMIYLARAGFNADQVLGSIEATLQLAQAGALGLGDAADIASNILQGFQLDVSETGRLVDIMAKAANSSNTDIRQLGDAMKYVGPVATGLGVSVEETTAAVSALSDAGLQSTLAGTGLRKVLLSLEVPTTRGAAALKRLGIAQEEVRVSQVGLTNALTRLKQAGISTTDAKDIFGLIGLPAFQVLDASIEKIDRLTIAYQNADGTAAKMAKTMDDNLNGALLGTKSKIEALILALADAGAESALIAALEGLQELLVLAADNADILSVAIVALALRAILPLAYAVGKSAVASVIGLSTQLTVLNAIAGRTTTALQLTTVAARGMYAVLGPWTIGIALAAAAFVALARDAEGAQRAIGRASGALEKYRTAILDIEADTKKLKDLQNDLRKAIEAQAPAAEATARREIAAIENRIRANESLAESYSNLLFQQIGKARSGRDENRERIRRLLIERKPFDLGFSVSKSGLDQAIADFQTELSNNRAKGIFASNKDVLILDLIVNDQEVLDGIKEMEEAYGRIQSDALKRRQAQLDEARDFRQSRDFAGSTGLRKDDILAATLGEEEQERVEAELDRQNRLRKDIIDLELEGRQDLVKARKEELDVSEKIVAALEAGKSIELAEDLAKKPKDDPASKKADDEAKRKKEQDEKAAAAQAERFVALSEELAINEALRAGDAARVTELERQKDVRELTARLIAAGVKEADAAKQAEAEVSAQSEDALAKKRKRIEDVIAARDLELDIQIAQAQGDEKSLKALEEKRDRLERINDLMAEGLTLAEATARADAEIARIKGGAFTEAQQARKEFTEGLSSDISSALSNAVRSGDYGNLFQETINSAAARGLEDAINDLADEIANMFGNIVFGQKGDGGLLGGILSGGAGTPPILDEATSAAATASVSGLGAAATGAATATSALATGGAGAAAAASALTPELAAMSLAVSAANSALAALAASSGASSASSAVVHALPFGGGRARGGPVSPGKFYEVNERGIAEMLSIGNRNFLMPGQPGNVTPLGNMQAGEGGSRDVARIDIYAHGTGNEELDRLMSGAVQRAVRISRAQAGPAAAEFQTRKV